MYIQEHPDTVGGAMLTGVREAIRILDMLSDRDHLAVTEAVGTRLRQDQVRSQFSHRKLHFLSTGHIAVLEIELWMLVGQLQQMP